MQVFNVNTKLWLCLDAFKANVIFFYHTEHVLLILLQAIFKFADTNNDAKISKEEYMGVVKKAPKINLK